MSKRPKKLTKAVTGSIEDAVSAFIDVRERLEPTAQGLVEQLKVAPSVGPFIHFIKYRVKDPDHLRSKLLRKALAARDEGKAFDISAETVFAKVTDLIGIRILHLHSQQFPLMHTGLMRFFAEQKLKNVEKPFAICWDSEYSEFYKSLGLRVRVDSSMYTSVHYTVELNQAAHYRCEIQVRTLMDEVWGEVSHTVNYPTESPIEVCRDQLRVLARLSSGCVRLVDAIFKADSDGRRDSA